MKYIWSSIQKIKLEYFFKYLGWAGCGFFFSMLMDLQSGKDIFMEDASTIDDKAIEGNPEFYISEEDGSNEQV